MTACSAVSDPTAWGNERDDRLLGDDSSSGSAGTIGSPATAVTTCSSVAPAGIAWLETQGTTASAAGAGATACPAAGATIG